MQKSVSVETNDPIQPKRSLRISGPVTKLYTMSQRGIFLRGSAASDVTDVLTIVPEERHRFKILDATMEDGRYVGLTWTEYQIRNRTAYRIRATNLRKQAGRYRDIINIKTDSDIQPVIRVRVSGVVTVP